MLGGTYPVIIFQFAKLNQALGPTVAKIPVISEIPSVIEQPPIPIYLDENVTGIIVDTEDKNIDIDTTTDTMTDGSEPQVNQKGIGTTLSITLQAKKNATGISLLTAMLDQVFEKLSSKEYAITYMNGAMTIFRGLVANYSASQNANTDLLTIKIELTRGQKQPTKKADDPEVKRTTGTAATLE